MDSIGEIKQLLFQILEGIPNERDIVRLSDVTGVIAKAYLQTHYNSFLKICSLEGESEADLANYTIKEVFARDKKGEFIQLRNFSASLNTTLKETNEEEVFWAYQAFVEKVALRRLIKLYKNVDPIGGRIYRNIYDHSRKDNTIVFRQELWGKVIHFSQNSSFDHLPSIPKDELERRFAIKMGNSTTIPDMLTVLSELLKEQNKWRRSLPVFDAVQLFKRYYSSISTYEPPKDHKPDLSKLTKFDLEILKKEIVDIIKQKILSTYVASQKVSLKEGEMLYKTLVDIIEDRFNEEAEQLSYFQYAKLNLKVSRKEYDEHWSSRVDYLIRTVREFVAVYLIEGL